MAKINLIVLFLFAFNCKLSFSLKDIKNNNSDFVTQDEIIEQQKSMDDLKLNKKQENFRPNDNSDEIDPAIFDERIDTLPKKCQHLGMPTNCDQATACTKRSGYYYIQLKHLNYSKILVECDAHTDGGSWVVIQKRQDGSVDFYRTWNEYKYGFGDINGEFYIGNDNLYALTNFDGPQELMILMEVTNGTGVRSAYAKYDSFAIGPENTKYILKRIGKYSGTAGDSLQINVGMEFATKDKDHNTCAQRFVGAWWYKNCHLSNLNGLYGSVEFGKGINWYTWTGHNASLKFDKMMIRRRRN